ncbi:BolA family protein [Marinobacterium sediminicola]|uniref:BolA protein n=1 Tax=Marinobacterium sediminicola TaxID=518898 RepID=A0ABY1RYL0_9GAMM|nr:BolA family protein [Marinobacterium sediminicola]ULG68142.1 BolA family transcriptional regulator [Marinobacterium sediminicola]SMR73345.1 BolA protein [Marinobacterium sediminicola]
MSVAEQLENLLQAGLNIQHIQLENESHMHSGPATESHFKLVLVSADFEGRRLVQRHQQVYGLVAELMQNPIHALALHLHTPEEWVARNGEVPLSPTCKGGSKVDKG